MPGGIKSKIKALFAKRQAREELRHKINEARRSSDHAINVYANFTGENYEAIKNRTISEELQNTHDRLEQESDQLIYAHNQLVREYNSRYSKSEVLDEEGVAEVEEAVDDLTKEDKDALSIDDYLAEYEDEDVETAQAAFEEIRETGTDEEKDAVFDRIVRAQKRAEEKATQEVIQKANEGKELTEEEQEVYDNISEFDKSTDQSILDGQEVEHKGEKGTLKVDENGDVKFNDKVIHKAEDGVKSNRQIGIKPVKTQSTNATENVDVESVDELSGVTSPTPVSNNLDALESNRAKSLESANESRLTRGHGKILEELGIPTTEMDYSKNKKTASIHFMNKPKKG